VFIGAINRYMRAVLEQVAREEWQGLPVYVARSGNFTVERILSRVGVGPLHSNDVSIYSCALGWYLAGERVAFRVRDPEFAWLEPYLEPGVSTVATLLLAGEMFRQTGAGDNAFAKRIRQAYRLQWPNLHKRTVERVKAATGHVSLASFTAGDCRDFLAEADRDAVCVSFPPTYRGGYERMFKWLNAVFEWPQPEYRLFDPKKDLEDFVRLVQSFREWLVSCDHEQPYLADHHLATVQTTPRARPVYMYASSKIRRLACPHVSVKPLPWPPRYDEVVWPLEIRRIDAPMMNVLRSQYLARHIATADAPRNYAVLSGGRLIGAFSFSLPRFNAEPGWLYLMSDFAVRPSPHRRLSKLILACVVSKGVQADLEQWRCSRIRTIMTTAFTNHPVSMKYRGIFKVYNRGEGFVNYVGPAGRWTLEEGYQWWLRRHSKR